MPLPVGRLCGKKSGTGCTAAVGSKHSACCKEKHVRCLGGTFGHKRRCYDGTRALSLRSPIQSLAVGGQYPRRRRERPIRCLEHTHTRCAWVCARLTSVA